MANRTAKDAHSVKGTNPQFLVEKIIRQRIYDNIYWKEHCFALTAELIVDKGMDLRYIGGIYAGNIKPTPFLCLLLKMLQIQPDKEIAIEFIRQEDFKYLRALGAIYIRLTMTSVEQYKLLEPLYNDYRKLRWMNKMGKFELIHMDDFIDNLLREERVCDIQIPRLQKREALEEVKELDLYKSLLDEDLGNLSDDSSDDDDYDKRNRKPERPKLVSRRRDRSREREMNERERRGEPLRRDDNRRERSRSRDRTKKVDTRDRRRSRSPDRRDDRRDERSRDDHRDRRDDRRGDHRSDRERERERERDGRGGDRERERDRGDRDRGDRDRKRRGNDDNDEKREIDEANALRAKLGLAPLQP